MFAVGQIRVLTDKRNHDGEKLNNLNYADHQLEGRMILTMLSLMAESEHEFVSKWIRKGMWGNLFCRERMIPSYLETVPHRYREASRRLGRIPKIKACKW